MRVPSISWVGASGKQYTYYIYPISKSFKEWPANFIISKESRNGFWIPCLIGETDNLKRYLRRINNDITLKQLGATHIHCHVAFGNAAERKTETQDLLRQWSPFGNELIKNAAHVMR